MESITDALQALLEQGMGEEGYYPEVRSIHVGESTDLILNDKYPVVMIASDEDNYDTNGNHMTVERNYGIVIHTLNPDQREAERIRDRILLNEFVSPPLGLIPFFSKNPRITIGNVDYYIDILSAVAATGKDKKGRKVAAAEIELKLERKFDL